MTPLPEPAYQRLSDLQSGIDDYYTEQQMRDYGKAEFERGLRAALEQQAEPVAWMDREGDLYSMPVIENWSPPHTLLYTTPPQRQWSSLTDDEIKEIIGPWGDMPIKGYTRELIDKIDEVWTAARPTL